MISEGAAERAEDAATETQPADTGSPGTPGGNAERAQLAEGIYFVTDPDLACPDGSEAQKIDTTAHQVEAAIAAGVPTIQLRWKPCDAGPLLALAKACVSERATFLINDRVDVFLAARAAGLPVAGVHIGQSDLPARLVREIVGPHAHIGWSAASAQELQEARELVGVIDSIGVGVVRDTATKTDAPPPLGVEGIAAIARDFPLPVVAIGGIKYPDIAPIAAAGIHSAAVVSAIACAADPGAACGELVAAWQQGKGA